MFVGREFLTVERIPDGVLLIEDGPLVPLLFKTLPTTINRWGLIRQQYSRKGSAQRNTGNQKAPGVSGCDRGSMGDWVQDRKIGNAGFSSIASCRFDRS
jgi:hypothetical protein